MRAFIERLRPYAPLTLRLIVGAIFILFGMQKVMHGGLTAWKGQITEWHLPAWVALATGWGAFAGGILVAAGFLTRLGAIACAAVVVLIAVKTQAHPPYVFATLERPLFQLAACVSLMLSGAGRLSIDRRIFGGM